MIAPMAKEGMNKPAGTFKPLNPADGEFETDPAIIFDKKIRIRSRK
jgi:hypothetical protein